VITLAMKDSGKEGPRIAERHLPFEEPYFLYLRSRAFPWSQANGRIQSQSQPVDKGRDLVMPKEPKIEATPELAASAAALAEAMKEIAQEMKLMHNTLKALARSQALIATQAQRRSNSQ
jgi:hypothetical protein